MEFYFSGIIYKVLFDPILSTLHSTVLEDIAPGDKVIDVACGTGSQAMAIAKKASSVTGIDLSERMISTAKRTARKRGIGNVTFELRDATTLTMYGDKEFDVAVTSMAVHQFEASLAVAILKEMKRIAKKVIIVDYNCPASSGLYRAVVHGIERMAGDDHSRNFRIYMKNGGIRWFTDNAGLTIGKIDT